MIACGLKNTLLSLDIPIPFLTHCFTLFLDITSENDYPIVGRKLETESSMVAA